MAKAEKYLPERDVTRSFDFGLGIILFVFALLFMFTKEVFAIRHGHQLDSLLLGFIGVLSLWASISKFERAVFLINVLLGLFLLTLTTIVGIFQVVLGIDAILNFRLDFTLGDFIFHMAIGFIFITIAVHWRKYRRSRYEYDISRRPD